MATNNETWEPCPAGELYRMVEHLEADRRRRTLTWFSGASALVALTVLVAFGVRGLIDDGSAPPLKCSDVVHQLEECHGGSRTAEEFVRKVAAQPNLDRHIENCPDCAAQYRKLIESVRSPTSRAHESRTVAHAAPNQPL